MVGIFEQMKNISQNSVKKGEEFGKAKESDPCL